MFWEDYEAVELGTREKEEAMLVVRVAGVLIIT